MFDARRRPLGHDIITKGLIDQVIVTPAAVFRTAIVANAKSAAFMLNHPSGDPSPSEADIRLTRQLIGAGKLLHVELVDSLIVGSSDPDGRCSSTPIHRGWVSLRELGYFQ
jgi:DNA repair protein RadC